MPPNTAIAAYTYDNNGNAKTQTQTQKFDAVTTNDAITRFDYDPLNRLTKITNALAGITQYNYDGVDHLVSVTDPKTLLTSYAVDGLDNQKQLISPDTGTTNSTYDAAVGNLKTGTDARSYSYDALNRVTATRYGYDTLGRLSSMTYPSGKILTYGFDIQGRIASMSVNAVNLVSGITYQPFGPAKSWTWSGGPVQTRAFDLDGRQTSYPYTATGTVNLTYDLGNRIKNLTCTVTKAYGYDKLDRLTTYSNEIYTYDADGNQSSHTVGATHYPYTYPSRQQQSPHVLHRPGRA